LLAGLGGKPEGLTESKLALIGRYQTILQPADIVPLLAVLGEIEPQLRQSGSPRLMVELLLLRWALLDRTVELGQVLKALGVGPKTPPAPPSPPPRSASPAPAPPPDPAPRASAPTTAPTAAPLSVAAPEKGPLTLDRLRDLWPQMIERARTASPMLATLLTGTHVAGLEGAVVSIRFDAGNAAHAEGVEHKRDAVARLVGEYVTQPVRVRVAAGPSSTKAARLTPSEAQAERLKALRAKDPALNAAVDALDLELLE